MDGKNCMQNIDDAGIHRVADGSDRPPAKVVKDAWTGQETLKLMLATAPIAIVAVDKMGRIAYTNAELEEMFGYSNDELLGRSIEGLIPERFREAHLIHRAQYARSPHVRAMGSGMDLAGRHKDGHEFPIEAGLGFLHIGEDLMVIGSITDITRRKQIEVELERRVDERTREIERRRQVADGLRDILTVLNSNRSLEDILAHIAAQACRLLYADASAIYRMQEGQGSLTIQASCGLPESYALNTDIPISEATSGLIAEGQPGGSEFDLPTNDINFGAGDLSPLEIDEYQALLTVPLIIKEETYGSLILYYRNPRRFTSEEIELATSVGDQTALAIENARLRTQVERTAVAAERSRIARDLHDSVTQTLFSASLIAEVLPRLWQRNRSESERRLEELRQLTRGALAEMRTLLLELRPATLIEVELSELLRQLTEAIMGRARVPIALEIQGDVPLHPDVKIAFYHIAQEALNNVAKHARASNASVTLVRTQKWAFLSIKDNGRGFEFEKVTAEHLGLTIMQERAQAIDGLLEIKTKPEQGTEVTVEWRAT